MLFEARQKRLIDIRSVDVALTRTSMGSPAQRFHHFLLGYQAQVNISRDVRRHGENLVVGKILHVMIDGGMNVFERSDHAFGRGPSAAADWARALRLPSPAAFQFIKRRIKLA